MSFVRKLGKDYYVCKSNHKLKGRLPCGKEIVSEFLVKIGSNKGVGTLGLGKQTIFPKELVGKKIRLRVEIIDEVSIDDGEDLFNKIMPKEFIEQLPFIQAKERDTRNKNKREYMARKKQNI